MDPKNIDNLIKLVETLRGEKGCPWDKKQTSQTMAVFLLEEVHELVDAIKSGKAEDVCEELGDVLFQIVFIVKLFEEAGHFDFGDVIAENTDKMIRRHPHVFGNDKVSSSYEVKKRWQKIKMKEKNNEKKSMLDSIPSGLPALMRAYRISERAALTGFDWDNISSVIQKVEEEWAELKSEIPAEDRAGDNRAAKNRDQIAMEFGDVLFTLVNLARFAHIYPEAALSDSIEKFKRRFNYMEEMISKRGNKIESASKNELNKLWEEAKADKK